MDIVPGSEIEDDESGGTKTLAKATATAKAPTMKKTSGSAAAAAPDDSDSGAAAVAEARPTAVAAEARAAEAAAASGAKEPGVGVAAAKFVEAVVKTEKAAVTAVQEAEIVAEVAGRTAITQVWGFLTHNRFLVGGLAIGVPTLMAAFTDVFSTKPTKNTNRRWF
jgi:hypothetical protein